MSNNNNINLNNRLIEINDNNNINLDNKIDSIKVIKLKTAINKLLEKSNKPKPQNLNISEAKLSFAFKSKLGLALKYSVNCSKTTSAQDLTKIFS